MKKGKFVHSQKDVPEALSPLLASLAEEYGSAAEGVGLVFERLPGNGSRVRVVREGRGYRIGFTSPTAAARGIGCALAGMEAEESLPFSVLGIMIDLSRNMTMTVPALKSWFRRLALAGYNMVMLYCEDTYVLEDEPVFGFMRGGYSAGEIRELDRCARDLGIELVGCIQTLGHMEQILRWSRYRPVRDTASVLLADRPETFSLIEKMLDFWSGALSSRRIHIGMDETHDLGRGVFLDRNGYERGFDIFNRHLARVDALCRERGLTPMIWSDMYFRLSNPEQEYYDCTSPIPDDVREAIPRDVQLVYWDYYHTDADFYAAMIRRHRELGFEPVMASGIWTWPTLWYDHGKTAETVPPCLDACRREHVKELIFTMWGDDGAFCDIDSALAGVFYAADQVWGGDGGARTAARFDAVCAPADYRAYLTAAKINAVRIGADGKKMKIFSSYLIWDDPLQGVAFFGYRRQDSRFDTDLLAELEKIRASLVPLTCGKDDGDLLHAGNIVDLLIGKLRFHAALADAYDRKDRDGLQEIAKKNVPELVASVRAFDASFRRQWMRSARPFGLERIQARNAALIARLEETAVRIGEFLDGAVPRIEELECRLPDRVPADNEDFARYALVSSGTGII
ncbi:MAG: hypothetical protein IJS01_00080 [Lentisphaeria bacterium]|nr:hypothetical protein [Lentisphaeria bacterium]